MIRVPYHSAVQAPDSPTTPSSLSMRSAGSVQFAGSVVDESFFPILPWSPLHGWEPPDPQWQDGLESIAECGFTVAGFVQPSDLPRCEALGLKAIMAPPRRPRYMAEEWESLSDTALDTRVREMVAATAGSPAVLGYFVMDEPGARHFPLLGRVIDALRRHAPDTLAYVNLYPDYATLGAPDQSQLGTDSYARYLDRFVAEARPQFLSYDNYRVLFSQDLAEPERAASYFENLLAVRNAALAHGLPWWQVVSSNQIRRHTPVPSPANLLLQAFTSLACGARGVGWFTYFAIAGAYKYTPVGESGERTPSWYFLQMVNRLLQQYGPVMNRLISTGVYATAPAPSPSFPVLPGSLVEAAEATVPLMVGELADAGGTPYAMVVNLSLERSAAVRLTLRDGRTASVVTPRNRGEPHLSPVDPERGTWLTAGQGALFRLGPAHSG